jgi:hypothetical protein
MQQGNIFYTAKQKVNLLASCFEENHKITTPLVGTSFDYAVDRLVDKYRKRRNPTTDGSPHFHTSTVQRLIRRLRPRTAPGLDGVTNRLLRHLPPPATKYLTALYNSSIRMGYFPTVWKQARVVAVHKLRKPPSEPLSYRPINLLPSISKILERLVAKRILQQTKEKSIIPNELWLYVSLGLT